MTADLGAVADEARNLFFQRETFAGFGRIAVVDASAELLDIAAERFEKLLKLALLSGVEFSAAAGEGLGGYNAQMVVGCFACMGFKKNRSRSAGLIIRQMCRRFVDEL